MLQPRPGETVLDVGCGPGGYAHAVQAAGACWIGLDASTGMLAFASNAGPAVGGSATSLPVRDGTVSALVAIGLADYLPNEPLGSFAREAARVLLCGGRAVVSCNASQKGLGVGRLRTGKPVSGLAALRKTLVSSGLKIEAEERLPGGLLSPDTVILLARKP
jgi:ubiquinone/menaquinone biosynthesis C-methylase UbiE